MPLYEYHCPKCGRFEVIRKFSDPPLTACPTCGAEIQKLASRLILQIHDELLLEVPEREAETAKTLVREVMEGALQLDVPLLAEARLGATWADVH